MAELRSYEPTYRDRIAKGLLGDALPGSARYNIVQGLMGSTGLGASGMGLVDLTPLGIPLSGQEAKRDADVGNWVGATMNAMGVIPAAKAPVRAGASVPKLIANNDVLRDSRTPLMYNPPSMPQRSFVEDYANAQELGGHGGRLAVDMDGRPLTARYVVGRTENGGNDTRLPEEAYDAIAKAGTGRSITYAPQSALGRSVGNVAVNRVSGEPTLVSISNSVETSKRPLVVEHELGHVIDEVSGQLQIEGLDRQFRKIYNDLNNPQSYGRPFGPEQNKYRGQDIDRELAAEAIRAYMSDPNYIKTVAPDVAARIREYVNPNPRWKDVVQFNALPLGLLGGGILGSAILAGDPASIHPPQM